MLKPYFQEGNIELYCGDSADVLGEIDGNFGAVVTDPPYGMSRFETDGKDYLLSVAPILQASFALLCDGGSMFVFTSTAEVVNVANAVGEKLRRMFWMYKPADCTYPYQGWLLTSEAILWFVKGQKPNLAERKPFKHDCYIHTRVGMEGVDGHPTVKPLAVIKDFVARCPQDKTVLDPFCGSGTTLIAAHHLGRSAIGIEIEERYCEIAAKRFLQTQLEFPN